MEKQENKEEKGREVKRGEEKGKGVKRGEEKVKHPRETQTTGKCHPDTLT